MPYSITFFAHAFLLVVSTLGVIGCERPVPNTSRQNAPVDGVLSKDEAFSASLAWLQGPVANDYSKAQLVFTSADGEPATNVAEIIFDPQMPSMQHGTATDDQVITAADDSQHRFVVDGIYFIMGGPWEINVTATVNGRRDTAAIPVDVP